MFVDNNRLAPGNLIPSQNLLSPPDQNRITEVFNKHFTAQENSQPEQKLATEGGVTIIQLRLLYETRYNQPHPWPKAFRKAELDCEGLAHYLMKGKVGKFEKIERPEISKADLEKGHKPYTCYEIWQPAAPWIREERGFWGPVHFFTHLENGEYISKNGLGPIRIFSSFKEMLEKDAFPFGFVTKDYKTTNDIESATIGESMIGTIF